MVLTDLAERFIKHGLYIRNWSPKTIRTYRQGLNAFQLSLRQREGCTADRGIFPAKEASANILTLAKTDLDAFVIWMRQKGLTAGGCNMYIRTVNSFLSWLHEEQLIQQKLKIRVLPNPSRPLTTFSDMDVRLILVYKPKSRLELRTWTLALLLFDTGVRIEEALGLERAKVDLDNLTIRVLGKGNKERVVPISLEFRKHLYRFMSKSSGRYIFATGSGQKLLYRNAYRDLKAVLGRIGVEGKHVHPHNFRHFFSCSFMRRGGNIYTLSRILGHTSISTTQLYLRGMGVEDYRHEHSRFSPLNQSYSAR